MGICELCLLALLPQAATGATIALKSGQSVQGEILGNVAMKSAVVEVSKDSARHKVAFYLVCPGSQVEAISQAGVNLRPGELTLLPLSWEPKEVAPSDLEALAAVEMDMGPYGAAFRFLPSGALVTRLKMLKKKPGSVDDFFAEIPKMVRGSSPAFIAAPKLARVLGTLHFEQRKPSLKEVEFKAASGPTSLPPASIVDFEGRAKP